MSKTHFDHLLVLILVYIVEAKSELRRILMHIYEFERSKEEQGAFSAPLAYYPESPFPFILRAFVQKCSCCCCREKMRPKMYFLRASHKSPQMFLAGYFIGASDRWSWWKKKMVLLEPPPPTLALAHSQLHTQYSLSLQKCHTWLILKPTDSARGTKNWPQ